MGNSSEILRMQLSNIKSGLRNNRTILSNFSYLTVLHIVNLCLTFVSYPYLIRVLGKETYGLIAFAQAIIGYLVILTGFGFNISATKVISLYQDDKIKLSEIVSSIFIIKGILFLVAILILAVLFFVSSTAQNNKILFVLTLYLCVHDVLFPIWYFQGIEKMKYITYISLSCHLLFLGFIFLFVKDTSDYLRVPVFNGLGTIMSSIAALFIIFHHHKIRFKLQSIVTLKYYFKDSMPIFVSNLSKNLYVNTGKVFVGSFLGMTEVSYYDLAEKIISLAKFPQSLLSQSIFPKVNRDKSFLFIKKIFKWSIVTNLFIAMMVYFMSKYFILWVVGVSMLPALNVIGILLLTLPIIAMSNVFGIQILIPFGHAKSFSAVIIISGFVYLLLLLFLSFADMVNVNNIALISVLTEIVVTATMFNLCKKYKLW
jgi:PST family polysaccharide transporter